MNIVLLHPAELPATGQVLLTERRAKHIHRVIQAKPGDNLRVGVVNGQMGLAEVLHCTDKQDLKRTRKAVDFEHQPSTTAVLHLSALSI